MRCGDPAAARSVLECRVGRALYPFELCEDRVLVAGVAAPAAQGIPGRITRAP
jgi:hypothetical protein